MLKLLKWSYDLGVKQERTRIASYLQLEAERRRITAISGYDMLVDQIDGKKMSDKRKERLEFDSRVHDEVNAIINAIMQPQETYTASLMFPIEDK